MAESDKNPLTWALGAWIQSERRNIFPKSETCATVLGVNDSAWRLVESGGTAISPKLALSFFCAIRTSSRGQAISWSKFSSLVAVARAVPLSGDGRRDETKKALLQLGQVDGDAKRMVKFLVSCLDKNLGQGGDKSLRDEAIAVIADYIGERVDNSHSDSDAAKSVAWEIIRNCDPVVFDQMLEATARLTSLNASVTGDSLDEWEVINAHRIRHIMGILLRHTLENELIGSSWAFLRKPFDCSCLVYCWEAIAPDELHAAKTRILEDNQTIDGERLTLCSLTEVARTRILSDIKQIAPELRNAHTSNFWSYELSYGRRPDSLSITLRDDREVDVPTPSNQANFLRLAQSVDIANILRGIGNDDIAIRI